MSKFPTPNYTNIVKTEPLTFADTTEALLGGFKTCTRRRWELETARIFTRYFHEERLIPAYDNSPELQGKEVTKIKLTCEPYLEKLSEMPESDLLAEGRTCGTVDQFITTYFEGDRNAEVWVIRFELVKSNWKSLLNSSSTIVETNMSDSNNVLEALENIITRESSNLPNFYKVGNALLKIRNNRLFCSKGYTSFISYCQVQFKISIPRIYQLINGAKTLNSVSTIVETENLSLTESHTRELVKIKDEEVRSLVLSQVARRGKITANEIKKEYQKMQLEAIALKKQPDLPPIGSVIRLTTKLSEEYKHLNCHWGIVSEIREYTICCQILSQIIPTLHPQYFVVLPDADCDQAIKLLNRLDKIYHHPEIDNSVRGVVGAIATKPFPSLSEWEEYLLTKIEERIIY